MPGLHGTLCINSFYPETELNITKIQEYEKQIKNTSLIYKLNRREDYVKSNIAGEQTVYGYLIRLMG